MRSTLHERLQELRALFDYTEEEAAQISRVSRKSYCSYEVGEPLGLSNERKYTYPKSDILEKYADAYGVSTDYLLGRINSDHVENEEISKITGLSIKSIEVLREIQENKSAMDNGGRAFGLYTDDYSILTTQFINYVLEENYDWINDCRQNKRKKQRIRPIKTVFTAMYNYIFADAICVKDMKDINPINETIKNPIDTLNYYDSYGRISEVVDTKSIWQSFNMDFVISWLNDKRNNQK